MPDDATWLVGADVPRIEGRAKVTGHALYASDEPALGAAYAFLVTSTIARGHIKAFDLSRARAVPGVLDILTYENVGDQADPPAPHGPGKETTTMQDNHVWHDGQIVGVVVADSYEAAREAAYKVTVDYAEETPSATFGSAGAVAEQREPGEHKDFAVGDAAAAFAAASAKVDQRYGTPTQHHNPIELFTTTAIWHDGSLTLYEPSQFVYGLRGAVAKQLRIDPKRVRVVARHVGGAFGSKGIPSSRSAWIAVAARRLGRPVKFVATRDQCYTIGTYRAETLHHIQLAAGADGKLAALFHEGWEVTSRPSDYNVSGTETTARMYACPNILTRVNVVHTDRNTPGFMRGSPGCALYVPARIRHGRVGRAAWPRPDRATPPQRHPNRPGDRTILFQPLADGVLRCGGQALWLEPARPGGEPSHRRLAGGVGLRCGGLPGQYRCWRRARAAGRRRRGIGADCSA